MVFCMSLEQRSTNLFGKGSNSKYYRLCRPPTVSVAYSCLKLWPFKRVKIILRSGTVQKRASGPIWSAGVNWRLLVCGMPKFSVLNINPFITCFFFLVNLFLALFSAEIFNYSDLCFCFPCMLSVFQFSCHFAHAVLFILNLFFQALSNFFLSKSSRSVLAHRD